VRELAAASILFAGCTQTSRVDDNLSIASLAQAKRAVAVMRVGAASPQCINVAVLLGVRDGDVTDWPLADLDRFKSRRPHIYAQMTTRLMTLAPRGPSQAGPGDCARLMALKAEGKVQRLPPECLPGPAAKRSKTGAVANRVGTL
jgi:hypothetical protein